MMSIKIGFHFVLINKGPTFLILILIICDRNINYYTEYPITSTVHGDRTEQSTTNYVNHRKVKKKFNLYEAHAEIINFKTSVQKYKILHNTTHVQRKTVHHQLTRDQPCGQKEKTMDNICLEASTTT